MDKASMPKLSIVIPFYNEQENVTRLCERLFHVLDSIQETWEVICVNDGSNDKTLSLLLKEKDARPGLVVVDLARNFGQHAAIMAGFAQCQGDWIITMDADLQNPPEEIPRLLDAFRQGHDLVACVRMNRQDSLFRKWASMITNRLMTRISGISLRDFGCMLRGYDREIVVGILENPEYRTFIPALAQFFARNPIEIEVRHEERVAGDSKYSILKLFGLQLDLLTGFSLWPLRVLFLVGSFMAFLGLALGSAIIVLRIVLGSQWAAQGVFTLFAFMFFLVGAQFFALGVLGEYIGRIFQAVRRRPPYIIGAVNRHEP